LSGAPRSEGQKRKHATVITLYGLAHRGVKGGKSNNFVVLFNVDILSNELKAYV
jgi:hypothetical protein